MKLVKTEFMKDIKKNKNTTSNPYGQAEYINEGIPSVL
jgi:hypothetical protein